MVSLYFGPTVHMPVGRSGRGAGDRRRRFWDWWVAAGIGRPGARNPIEGMRIENGRILVTHNVRTPVRRAWLSGMVILLVLSLFAAACGDDDEGGATTAAPGTTAAPVEGRSLTIALAEEPRTLASWNAYSNDGHPVVRNVTEALMRRSAGLARAYGVRLHTHVAETLDEEAYCLKRVGLRPIRYMEALGWLGPDVWWAHVDSNHGPAD